MARLLFCIAHESFIFAFEFYMQTACVSQTYFRGSTENVTLSEIQEVVDLQRRWVEREMEGYEYPNGKYDVNVRYADLRFTVKRL